MLKAFSLEASNHHTSTLWFKKKRMEHHHLFNGIMYYFNGHFPVRILWTSLAGWVNLIFLWFSYGFPMVFQFFYTFPLVFLWFSYVNHYQRVPNAAVKPQREYRHLAAAYEDTPAAPRLLETTFSIGKTMGKPSEHGGFWWDFHGDLRKLPGD